MTLMAGRFGGSQAARPAPLPDTGGSPCPVSSGLLLPHHFMPLAPFEFCAPAMRQADSATHRTLFHFCFKIRPLLPTTTSTLFPSASLSTPSALSQPPRSSYRRISIHIKLKTGKNSPWLPFGGGGVVTGIGWECSI